MASSVPTVMNGVTNAGRLFLRGGIDAVVSGWLNDGGTSSKLIWIRAKAGFNTPDRWGDEPDVTRYGAASGEGEPLDPQVSGWRLMRDQSLNFGHACGEWTTERPTVAGGKFAQS